MVLVDPPRAGMARKALQRAAALGADRLVYVSCNPTTLAGNGAELAELGYGSRASRPWTCSRRRTTWRRWRLFERRV